MQTTILLLGSFVALWVIRMYLSLRKSAQSIQGVPSVRTLLGDAGVLGLVFPRIPLISEGPNSIWRSGYKIYSEFGWDVYTSVKAWPKAHATIVLADADAIKEVTTYRARFPKPLEMYQGLAVFGSNIVVSEGEEWKKHRKTAAPAFSERNNKLVWDETVRSMTDLFKNVWGDQKEVSVNNISADVTLPVALMVIAAAGFGRRMSWKDEQKTPPGHTLLFTDVMHHVSENVVTRVAIPKWAVHFSAHVKTVFTAFEELEQYLQEMVEARKTTEKDAERFDLFSNLLAASEEEGDVRIKLSDRDVSADIYMFLLAGHETSGHTLGFALGLLALYPTEQELLYEHIKSVLPDGRIPNYEDMTSLTRVSAVLQETLRLFPAVVGIPKTSVEDTTLTVSNSAGDKLVFPVPKGTDIMINTVGLHYNPRYWNDPYAFKPERFFGDWPRDAYIPFSGGSRSCIGRRFFETSALVVLTMIVMRYKFEVLDEAKYAAETFQQRYERVLKANAGLTLTPARVPLVFKRR